MSFNQTHKVNNADQNSLFGTTTTLKNLLVKLST